jgi:hypothetical protein
MSLVLAIEPDAQQAEAVRQIVRERIGAELVLVNSTYAAVAAMNRRVPDLILLGATISDKGQSTVIKHLRSLSQAADQQALVIPPLQHDEPVDDTRPGLRRKRQSPRNKHAEFADVIGGALERTRKARRGLALPRPRGEAEALDAVALDGAEPLTVESVGGAFDAAGSGVEADDPALARQDPTPEPTVTDAGDDGFVTIELESLVASSMASSDSGGDSTESPDTSRSAGPSAPPDADPVATSGVEARIHAAQIALIQADAEARLAHELERARAEAREEQAAQLGSLRDDADALRAALSTALSTAPPTVRPTELPTAVQEARAATEAELRDAFAAQLAAQLADARAEAEDTLADTVIRIRSEAEQTLETEVARARADVEASLRAELERARAAADEARLAEHNARLETVRRAADVALARADTEAAVAAELDRALEAAAQEHRLQTTRLQAEADALRDVAVREARAAADAEARDAAAAELARVRADAEHALTTTVHQIRSEAERTLVSELSRVRYENETAIKAVEDARRAAEAVAAQVLDREVARVRSEAEARLEAELHRARVDGDARLAEQDVTQSTKTRDAEIARAKAEARATADASAREAMTAELARVRAEADAVLAETVHRLRIEAAQAQAAELAQARAQTEQVTNQLRRTEAEADSRLRAVVERLENEAERARRSEQSEANRETERRLSEAIGKVRAEVEEAGARALTAEVARLAAETAAPRPHMGPRAVDLLGIRGQTALPSTPDVAETAAEPAWTAAHAVIPWPRVSRGTLSAAAALLLVVGGTLFVDVAAIVRSAGDASAAWLGREASQPSEATPPAAAPVAPRLGTLRVESTPGARVTLDGQDRGASPLTIADLRPGRHALVLRNESGTVRRSVMIRADEQTIAADQIISGFLTVFSRIRLDIYVAGQRIGTTEDGQLLVAAGRHTLTLVNERFNYKSTVVLEVQPGAATPHTVSLPNGTLRISTTPGAEVWIDGERLGTAPLGDLPVQIGTREVLVKSPALGERRQVVEVRHGESTDVTLPLERTESEPRDVD